MAFQYCYTVYDFHWPADQQERLDQMVADGWQINTAIPNTLELAVVWQRELPAANKPDPGTPAKGEVSGGLRDHEGQGAR